MENPLNTSAACETILGVLISNPITGQMRDARWWVGFTKKKGGGRKTGPGGRPKLNGKFQKRTKPYLYLRLCLESHMFRGGLFIAP